MPISLSCPAISLNLAFSFLKGKKAVLYCLMVLLLLNFCGSHILLLSDVFLFLAAIRSMGSLGLAIVKPPSKKIPFREFLRKFRGGCGLEGKCKKLFHTPTKDSRFLYSRRHSLNVSCIFFFLLLSLYALPTMLCVCSDTLIRLSGSQRFW